MPKWGMRADGNHGEITSALRKAGALVLDLRRVGGGCPDLLVCVGSSVLLMEIKQKGKTINQLQQAFQEKGWPVVVVYTVEEALAAIEYV